MPHRAVMLFGPFMPAEQRSDYGARAERLPMVTALTFDSHIEALIDGAVGLVAMGGYNTFCEILSFDKPALVVPRTTPRLEQFIRACRAEELGLIRMLSADDDCDPQVMVDAIKRLPTQPRPSEAVVPGLLEGLDNISRLVSRWLAPPDLLPDPLTVSSEPSDRAGRSRAMSDGPAPEVSGASGESSKRAAEQGSNKSPIH